MEIETEECYEHKLLHIHVNKSITLFFNKNKKKLRKEKQSLKRTQMGLAAGQCKYYTDSSAHGHVISQPQARAPLSAKLKIPKTFNQSELSNSHLMKFFFIG